MTDNLRDDEKEFIDKKIEEITDAIVALLNKVTLDDDIDCGIKAEIVFNSLSSATVSALDAFPVKQHLPEITKRIFEDIANALGIAMTITLYDQGESKWRN